MRLLGHIDWSSARPATAAVRALAGDSIGSIVEDGPRAALTASSVELVAAARGIVLAGDARIDNLEDLRTGLRCERGERLAETLIRAYEAWGQAFADHLVGDFAIVLWDGRRRCAVAARDPFGVRPIFYRREGDRLWIASTVAALLPTVEGAPVLDEERVCEHLLWRYRSTEATFFRAIREVPPGFVLTATEGKTSVTRYWRPPAPRAELARDSPEELWSEVRRLFVQAVKRRLQSAHPVVVHVSGGLDSSSIAMAADMLWEEGSAGAPGIIGASQIFPGLACDEEPFIDAVAKAIRFPVEKWDGRRPNLVDLLDPAPEGPGCRMTSTSGQDGDVTIARELGADVILSGFGGDDIMMINGFIRDMIARGEWVNAARAILLPRKLRASMTRLGRVAGQFLPHRLRQLRTRHRTKVPAWLEPRWHDTARNVEVEDEPDVNFASHVQRLAWTRLGAAQARRAINAMQTNGMTLGYEYRYPYLDRDLVTFILGLPPQALPWAAPQAARIHREAFRSLLPPEIANRYTKAEFTPAIANRVRQAGSLIEGQLATTEWACQKYVTRDAAARFYRDVTTARSAPGMQWHRIWNVATLEAWMRSVLRYPHGHKERALS